MILVQLSLSLRDKDRKQREIEIDNMILRQHTRRIILGVIFLPEFVVQQSVGGARTSQS